MKSLGTAEHAMHSAQAPRVAVWWQHLAAAPCSIPMCVAQMAWRGGTGSNGRSVGQDRAAAAV